MGATQVTRTIGNAAIVIGAFFIALVLFHPDPNWPPPRYTSGLMGILIIVQGLVFRKMSR